MAEHSQLHSVITFIIHICWRNLINDKNKISQTFLLWFLPPSKLIQSFQTQTLSLFPDPRNCLLNLARKPTSFFLPVLGSQVREKNSVVNVMKWFRSDMSSCKIIVYKMSDNKNAFAFCNWKEEQNYCGIRLDIQTGNSQNVFTCSLL